MGERRPVTRAGWSRPRAGRPEGPAAVATEPRRGIPVPVLVIAREPRVLEALVCSALGPWRSAIEWTDVVDWQGRVGPIGILACDAPDGDGVQEAIRRPPDVPSLYVLTTAPPACLRALIGTRVRDAFLLPSEARRVPAAVRRALDAVRRGKLEAAVRKADRRGILGSVLRASLDGAGPGGGPPARSIAEAARRVRCSRAYLSGCGRTTGTPLASYLEGVALLRALRELLLYDRELEAVADSLAYADGSGVRRLCTRVLGLSLADVRWRHVRELEDELCRLIGSD